MAQPLLTCLGLIHTSPEEVGLVPTGKFVTFDATISLIPLRFMALPPITAVDTVAPEFTGEVEPVESWTLPFKCRTEQWPFAVLKTFWPLDSDETKDLPQYILISCLALALMLGILIQTAAPTAASHCSI